MGAGAEKQPNIFFTADIDARSGIGAREEVLSLIPEGRDFQENFAFRMASEAGDNFTGNNSLLLALDFDLHTAIEGDEPPEKRQPTSQTTHQIGVAGAYIGVPALTGLAILLFRNSPELAIYSEGQLITAITLFGAEWFFLWLAHGKKKKRK